MTVREFSKTAGFVTNTRMFNDLPIEDRILFRQECTFATDPDGLSDRVKEIFNAGLAELAVTDFGE